MEIETISKDLIIIGAGPSGLAAAITAKEEGIDDILVIEKMDILGGNAKYAMNFYDMPNSKAMEKNGVKLTKEEFIDFLVNQKGAWETSERLKAWADSAWTLDEWLRSMGIQLNYHFGGEKATNHLKEENEYAGKYLVEELEKRIDKLGIEVWTKTRLNDVIIEDNRVVGIVASGSEKKYEIYAEAVILATGGFSANKELLAEYVPGAEKVATSNQEGAEGDIIPIAKENNFQLDHMKALKIHPTKLKNHHYLTGSGDGYILVNENSERFMDETAMGLPRAHTILEQPKGNAYYIIDEERKEAQPNRRKHAEVGFYEVGKNLADLAEKLHLDAEKLENEIKIFNQAVENKEGDPYRKNPSAFKIDPNGPMYGTLVESAIHMTSGGLVANEKAQVLNTENEVIPGLYVSGEATNQSGGFSQSVAFGRIAGHQAAKNIK